MAKLAMLQSKLLEQASLHHLPLHIPEDQTVVYTNPDSRMTTYSTPKYHLIYYFFFFSSASLSTITCTGAKSCTITFPGIRPISSRLSPLASRNRKETVMTPTMFLQMSSE
ncbi:uncharacterized protein K441DRAFT_277912 [Cenococcum geophilum 1.58]|uniref:uncharacterized protein n=1 Tax=Cenococcum geophilum 1.58 TaxID=794803 RepID=UPI00358F3453|nr:hypothetical protein K441DRAFT_277912 [Cenococcum geophilum 1.58]